MLPDRSLGRRALLLAILIGGGTLAAQSGAAMQVLRDVLPPGTNSQQITLSRDGQRAYFLNSAGELWLFDRARKTSARLAEGNPWDLTISPAGDALAYTRSGEGRGERYVWLLPLDVQTGLAAGPERRLSPDQGDVPSISPDGKWVAFARNDTTGVGQSIVIVPIGGGAVRVVAPALPSNVDHIRWTPDGKKLYFGVNPPVPCDPDWSCLPLPKADRNPAGSVRRVGVDGGPVDVIAAARSSSPGLSPDGRVIVYGEPGTAGRYVVADANGRRLDTVSLTRAQAATGWLRGSTLLVREGGNVRRLHAFSMADGQSRLMRGGSDAVGEPAWSADGRLISVLWRTAEQSEIRILNADGSLRKTLPISDGFVRFSSWSPDQRWIAYTGYPSDGSPRLRVVEVATGRTTSVFDFARGGPAEPPVWLPDSRAMIVSLLLATPEDRRVAFRQVDLSGSVTLLREVALGTGPNAGAAAISASSALVSGSTPLEYRSVSLAGDAAERVILSGLSGFVAGAPTFSPDRQWFAVRRNPSGSNNARLNVLELLRTDGTGRVTIDLPFSAAPGQGNPVILPGAAELVVFEAPGQGGDPGVYSVTVATKAVKKLFTYSARFGPPEVAISPDGRSLLYAMTEALPPSILTLDLSSLTKSGGR